MRRSLQDRLAAMQAKALDSGVVETTHSELATRDMNVSDTEPNKSVEAKYLPVGKLETTPTPNVILRSSLFGVVQKGARRYEERTLKASLNGCTVKYTGKQLDQSDLDVWLECIRRCQGDPLGKTIRFSAHAFLKSLGQATGKSQHEWLKSVFLRLRANDLDISDGRYHYMGSLVTEQYVDDDTGENCIVLNPKIIALFGDNVWTSLSKTIRFSLKGKSLSLWLYSFYATHNTPHPMKVQTLKELCGSETKELKKFRQQLSKSLSELVDITGWTCWIDKETDLVHVVKVKAVRHE